MLTVGRQCIRAGDFTGLFNDSFTIFTREMLIFKSSIRTNVIRSLMFPLVIILFFGQLGNSVSNVPTAIANYANNQQSMQFINALEAQGTLSITAITNQESAMSMLQSGQVYIVVVILPNFPSSGTAPSVYVYYANTQFTSIGVALPFIQNAAAGFGASAGSQLQTQNSTLVAQPTSGATTSYRDFLIASVIIMAVAFGGIFSGGFSTILDRQLGSIKLFLIAPINKNAIILGKMLSGTVQSIFYGILALLLGLLFGAQIAMGIGGLIWILLLIFFVALAFSALALLIASRIRAIEQYAIVAQMITLPTWFLSGAFFPASSFPAFLQPFSIGDPLTYATAGLRQIMLAGYIIPAAMLLDLTVLAIFSLIVVIMSFALFKKTID